MSLLNQMLQDLEHRNAQDTESLLDKQRSIHVVYPKPGAYRFFLLGAIAMLTLGAVLLALSDYRVKESPEIPPIAGAPAADAEASEPAAIKTLIPDTAIQKPRAAVRVRSPKKTVVQATPPVKLPPARSEKRSPPAIKPSETQYKPAPIKKVRPLPLYRQALKQPSPYARQRLLEKVIARDPDHIEARIALTKTLLAQGKTRQAAAFLDQSLRLLPGKLPFIKARAQLFLQQKDLDAALLTLQQVAPAPQQDTIYFSLLASTYQQKRAFSQSSAIYRRLVVVVPEKAEYWLGLALAEENLGNRPQALYAYRQALGKKSLKNTIVSYIKQRVNVLGRSP